MAKCSCVINRGIILLARLMSCDFHLEFHIGKQNIDIVHEYTYFRPVTSGVHGVHGVRSHPPPPQAPKVHILILDVQAKEYSRLN